LSLQEASEIAIEDREALRSAVKLLEHPSLAGRLTNLVGKPVELIGYALPAFASQAIAVNEGIAYPQTPHANADFTLSSNCGLPANDGIVRPLPPQTPDLAPTAQSHAFGVFVLDELEARSSPHVQRIVDIVERYGR
jgi:hypothetical protein